MATHLKSGLLEDSGHTRRGEQTACGLASMYMMDTTADYRSVDCKTCLKILDKSTKSNGVRSTSLSQYNSGAKKLRFQ